MNYESSRRRQIVELLQLFQSEQEQIDYEKNVPHVDITNELLCMWFDDQYHPDLRHFPSCFSTDELEALAQFHRFYDGQTSKLPPSKGTVRTWLASPVWRAVMQKASDTLSKIDLERKA